MSYYAHMGTDFNLFFVDYNLYLCLYNSDLRILMAIYISLF